jgi:hypothetical protein
VLLDLRRNEMALQRGQDRLGLRQAEAQRRRGMPTQRTLAGADLMHLPRAVSPGQLQHHPPPHRVPGPDPPAQDIAPPQVLDGLNFRIETLERDAPDWNPIVISGGSAGRDW